MKNLVLCLETATTNCSVALGSEKGLLGVREDNSPKYSHAEKLHVFISELLSQEQVGREQLAAVAVSKGPGSYTGLRIGVSAAKGLCFALGIPLLSLGTLEVLARQAAGHQATVIPLLDARRMEVYTAGFDQDLNPLFETRSQVLEPDSFSEQLEQGKVIFLGNGVRKFEEICSHPNAIFWKQRFPAAADMLPGAVEKLARAQYEDLAYFEPFYLKDFQAG